MGQLSNALAKGLKPFHRQATATIVAVEYALGKGAKAIKLVNRGTKGLLYSIDGGTLFHLVQPKDVLDEAFECTTIQLKSVSTTTAFDLHAALTQ